MKIQLIGGPRDGKFCEFNTSLQYYEFPIHSPAKSSDSPRFGPTLSAIGRYEFDGKVLRWGGQRALWDGISDDFDDSEKFRFQ